MTTVRLGRLLALALVAAACGTPETGAALYEQQCAACHEPGGSGAGSALDSGTAVTASDAELAAVIQNGRNTMPGFPRLSSEQIDSLVVYIRSIQGDE